ncbi:ThiF family adenylyltransferase, partial [Candidatus Chlorohelix sp.]|uniref:HesA/MoeB/ThiF family protein n=1 Tax=Candidatus Chlorohelix sp. TaxID=3139201 RepID=UPI00305D7189
LLHLDSPSNILLGRWQRGEKLDSSQPGELVLLAHNDAITFYKISEEGSAEEVEHERLTFYDDFKSRIAGLLDTNALANKTVAIIGLGTGGGTAAVELAKAGVGKFRLADFDRLKVHNVVRHVCGMRDIGRLKTDALKDLLLNTNPLLKVETFNIDVTEHLDTLEQLLDGCDLVVGATDSEEAKGVINRISWNKGIPAVYGAAYEMGFGGDVFMAIPGVELEGQKVGCYMCFRIATSQLFGEQDHDEIEDYGALPGRPQLALSMDVGHIALIMARTALSVLSRYDKTSLVEPYPANWILWGNQPKQGWIFDEPLQSRFVDIWSQPDCPVCGQPVDKQLQEEATNFVESLTELEFVPAAIYGQESEEVE